MKELVLIDIDNTIAHGFSQKMFVDYLLKTHDISFFYWVQVVLWFVSYKLGLSTDPTKAMERGFVYIKDKSTYEIEKKVDHFFNDEWVHHIFPEMNKIIREHLESGREIILVSNAPDVLVRRIAQHWHITRYISTALEVKNEKYTGKIKGRIIYGEEKSHAVLEYIRSQGLSLENSWAYGDHDSDIHILSHVTHPVLVNPSTKLKKYAQEHEWLVLNFKQ